jgi:hypothetical protein
VRLAISSKKRLALGILFVNLDSPVNEPDWSNNIPRQVQDCASPARRAPIPTR